VDDVRRQIWRASEDGLKPGHFVIFRHRTPVGHLYVNPRAVPFGLPAIRQVVVDMMLAASDVTVGDELYARSLGIDDLDDDTADDGR
jgi:hypothetical protein